MMQLVRVRELDGRAGLRLVEGDETIARLPRGSSVAGLLRQPLGELRGFVEAVAGNRAEPEQLTPLAPIDGEMEVWAAGVTYQRSEEARVEESDTPDIYSRVYLAERPELFFKATPRRVAGPGDPIGVRADSSWDVPEPELALVINALGEIVGYTIGNDVSSRSLEGENPLYLPQAKVYARCCALGPGVTLSWDVPDPYDLTMHMAIERGERVAWEGETSTGGLRRRIEELVEYLFREDDFPDGVILCTGTALVPDSPFTLKADDVVSITIGGLGTLRNPVVRGKSGVAR